MADKGTMQDQIDDLMQMNRELLAECDRLLERLVLKDSTIDVLRAEVKRVSEELARRYE